MSLESFYFYIKAVEIVKVAKNNHEIKFFFLQTKAELLQLNSTRFPSLEILLAKKLEIEKTKNTFIISVLKVVH